MLHQIIERPVALPRHGQNIEANVVDLLVELMQRKGLAAQRGALADGAPAVRGAVDGLPYLVAVRDTTAGPVVQFAGQVPTPVPLSAEAVEDVIRQSWFIRVMRAPGGVHVAMEIPLEGGVSRVWLSRQLVRWETWFGHAAATVRALRPTAH